MCRLALVSHKFTAEDDMINLFKALEKTGGGHGNGIGGFLGTEAYVDKALKMTVKECFDSSKHFGDEDFIFHTRIASIGGKEDILCHPFHISAQSCETREVVFAHNGTWRGYDQHILSLAIGYDYDLADLHFSSDSMIMAILTAELGIYAPIYGTGVYLWQEVEDDDEHQSTYVYVSYGDFQGLKLENGGWIYASRIPTMMQNLGEVWNFPSKTMALLDCEIGPTVVFGDKLTKPASVYSGGYSSDFPRSGAETPPVSKATKSTTITPKITTGVCTGKSLKRKIHSVKNIDAIVGYEMWSQTYRKSFGEMIAKCQRCKVDNKISSIKACYKCRMTITEPLKEMEEK